MQCVKHCDSPNPEDRELFEQPVVQTLQMFVGEMGCWLVIGASYIFSRFISKNDDASTASIAEERPLLQDSDDEGPALVERRESVASSNTVVERQELSGWKVVLMALPALCDIIGTTLMNVGLLFVAASIYQMTRGALVLFVGLFSVIFLKRHLGAYKWFALFVVVLGVALVGLAGAIDKHQTTDADSAAYTFHNVLDYVEITVKKQKNVALWTVIGVCIIACAQVFTAFQFVIEESIMERYSVEPLHAVGWEGIWGFLFTFLGMIIGNFAYGKGYFNMREGLYQTFMHPAIAVSSLLIMISIG